MKQRIPIEETKNPDAVERLFVEKFKNLKKHQMNEEETRVMIGLLFAAIPEDDKEMNEQFLVKVIDSRSKYLAYELDIKTKVFLAYKTGNPGSAVMYVYYLAWFCKSRNIKKLSFNEFCENGFPFGFPSNEDLNDLWDEQKVLNDGKGSDNLLDYWEASQSIVG